MGGVRALGRWAAPPAVRARARVRCTAPFLALHVLAVKFSDCCVLGGCFFSRARFSRQFLRATIFTRAWQFFLLARSAPRSFFRMLRCHLSCHYYLTVLHCSSNTFQNSSTTHSTHSSATHMEEENGNGGFDLNIPLVEEEEDLNGGLDLNIPIMEDENDNGNPFSSFDFDIPCLFGLISFVNSSFPLSHRI
jgi:hypothetical protein